MMPPDGLFRRDALHLSEASSRFRIPQSQFVILDRDGTINLECDYLSHPDQLQLLPNAAAGLRQLAALGLKLIVVTNQSGIGRGYFDEQRLAEIHAQLNRLLLAEGVGLAAIYHCPHTPDAACDCRKPLPALVQRAARDFGFDPRDAFVIGDKPSDIALGKNVGATTFLVRTGYGARSTQADPSPDHVVEDLAAAADVISHILKPVPTS